MLQHAREIAPSVSWEILVRVKRSGGMSVNELAAELKMSYMGVKQHCDDLRKQGYVDTWRRPKGTGRPEKIYRPTPKLDLILTNWGSELCLGLLALASQAYGEAAPDRLLYGYLQQKVERWGSKLKGKLVKERAAELVKLRNADGWMSEISVDEYGVRLLDHHSPLADVARLYPNVWEMESRALMKIFGGMVERTLNGYRSEIRLPQDDGSPPLPIPVVSPTPVVVVVKPEKQKQPEPVAAPESISPPEEEVLYEDAEPEEEVKSEPERVTAYVPQSPSAFEAFASVPAEAEPESHPESEPEPEAPPVFSESDSDARFEDVDASPLVELKEPHANRLEPVSSLPRLSPKPKTTTAASKSGKSVQADLFDF